jgi:F0F1-type ATP synthase assembly protein I
MPIYLKYLITAALVVVTSELANRSEKIGALVGALPVMTIIVILWMFTENKAAEGADKIATYVYYTFWYVLPTLPMLIVMSQMLKKGSSFWLSLGVYVVGTIVLFFMLNLILKRFSINLI